MLDRQQLGEFAAKFLDLADEVQQPVICAGFVAIVKNTDGSDGVVTRTSSTNGSVNIKMFHRAVELEHAAVVDFAAQAIRKAQGLEPGEEFE